MFEVFATDKETGNVVICETVNELYLCTAKFDEIKNQTTVKHLYSSYGQGGSCAIYHVMACLPEQFKAMGREFAESGALDGLKLKKRKDQLQTESSDGTHDSCKLDIEMILQAVRDTFADKEGV